MGTSFGRSVSRQFTKSDFISKCLFYCQENDAKVAENIKIRNNNKMPNKVPFSQNNLANGQWGTWVLKIVFPFPLKNRKKNF